MLFEKHADTVQAPLTPLIDELRTYRAAGRSTAARLLDRLFDSNQNHRWELQSLANAVGMGKTVVSLAVAYSVLYALEERGTPEDLGEDFTRCSSSPLTTRRFSPGGVVRSSPSTSPPRNPGSDRCSLSGDRNF
jgi:predicted sugar kinase